VNTDEIVGFKIISTDDLDDIGINEVIRRIRERIGDSPVYLSLDIDVIDPGLAPATGTPEAGGWTTREVKRIIRGLAGLNFVYVLYFGYPSPTHRHSALSSAARTLSKSHLHTTMQTSRALRPPTSCTTFSPSSSPLNPRSHETSVNPSHVPLTMSSESRAESEVVASLDDKVVLGIVRELFVPRSTAVRTQ